jgi:chromosome segregation ATPase
MRQHDRIEEPPPVPRYTVSPSARPGQGLFVDWRRRFSAEPPRLRFTIPSRPGMTRAIVLGLVALAVIGMQAWTLHGLSRVRDKAAVDRAELDQARISLGLLWALTERLDEEQIAGLGQLADSIRSVFAYAQGEVRLWETAYYAQEQRLDDNAASIARHAESITRVTNAASSAGTRLVELARADEAKQSRLDALERESRTHATAVAMLARRTEGHGANLVDVTEAVGSLRESLASLGAEQSSLDAELGGLENQVASSGSALGEIDTRVERLDGWIDGFRRAGLSGETVQSRLATLASELRRVTMRVDSLRSRGPAVLTSQQDN